MSVSGTRPRGVEGGEQQTASWVQQTFAGIAPRYDLLNHLLSFNIDCGWRKALLRSLVDIYTKPDATILDLCCGTGDVFLDLKRVSKAKVMAADFCHPMLLAAQAKSAEQRMTPSLFEGDALQLPLANESLDAISIAFGFRNLANYDAGLRELHRVLRPGGVLAILEFSHPPGLLVRSAYNLYSRIVLPTIGGLISGSRAAYSYLPESIAKFPPAAELNRMMEAAGFKAAQFELLSGGIAALHTARS